MTNNRPAGMPQDHITALEFSLLLAVSHTTFAALRKRADFPQAHPAPRKAITFNHDEALAFALAWNEEQAKRYHGKMTTDRFIEQAARIKSLTATQR